MAVVTKERNLELWRAGAFGNTLRTWPSIASAVADHGFAGPYVVRSRSPGGRCRYHGLNTRADLRAYMEWLRKLWPLDEFYVNERMPDQLITIQGEVGKLCSPLRSYVMFFSTAQGHMRECLKRAPEHAEGLQVKLLLDAYLPDHSWVLWDLLQLFDDHVVEFVVLPREKL